MHKKIHCWVSKEHIAGKRKITMENGKLLWKMENYYGKWKITLENGK